MIYNVLRLMISNDGHSNLSSNDKSGLNGLFFFLNVLKG